MMRFNLVISANISANVVDAADIAEIASRNW